jgi:hypothetical protein
MPKPKSTSRLAPPEADEEYETSRLDPIIKGLLDRLPAPGDEWSQQDREQWLQVLRLAFALIYHEPEPPSA